MGQDKAMLCHNGMTLLEHAVSALLPVVERVVVVAETPEQYMLPCSKVIADAFPDCGPVGGILTGLMHLGPGSHVVVACDMPCIQESILRLLLRVSLDWEAVVPEIGGRLEPLCAVYRYAAVPKLMQFLEADGRAVHQVIEKLITKRIGEGVLRRIDPELKTFININTPEELAAFEAGRLAPR
jgi:molybdopterin-guanine dinucleotide biosynthesis protein A